MTPPETAARRLGTRLRQLREEQSWSVATAAAQPAMDVDELEPIESGSTLPSPQTVESLASVYGETVVRLVTGGSDFGAVVFSESRGIAYVGHAAAPWKRHRRL